MVASSSHMKTVRGCCWNADTVHMWFTPSSMALYKANALCTPVMRIMTWEEVENVDCGLSHWAKATFFLLGRQDGKIIVQCTVLLVSKVLTGNNENFKYMAWLGFGRNVQQQEQHTQNRTDGRHSSRLLTSLASMTVPTPTVSATVGTSEASSSKNRELAMRVSFARVFNLVLETRLEPGSLKAMWPSGPIPDKTRGVVWILLFLQ